MFRRATLAVVVIAILVLAAISGTAQASGVQVIQDRFHGPFAEAGWEASTPTSITDVGVLTSQEQNGTTHLSVFLQTSYLDSSGNVTGSVDENGELTGPSFSFDTLRLSTASASGIVPVTRCTFDAAGNPTGCTEASLDVSTAWTGQGPMFRGNEYVDWFVQPGDFTYVDRGSGTFRQASATATIGGQAFDASELQFADLGVSNDLTLTVCPHGC